MGVPLPGGHHEDIAFRPIKFVRRDLGRSLTTKCVIDGRARVTMRFSVNNSLFDSNQSLAILEK